MSALGNLKRWVKSNDHPTAAIARQLHSVFKNIEIPAHRIVYQPLFALIFGSRFVIRRFLRVCLWTPMFKVQISECGNRLFLYGGVPMLMGGPDIKIGDDCRVSGQTTFSARCTGNGSSKLCIGNNVDIGWRSTIAIGTQVKIGNNVRIAERAFLAGYPGHPMDADDRAAGLPETDDQVGDIILEDDVWLASGVTVLPGVTIGKGTVVGAGSVVTKSLPSGVVAAGVPARVIKKNSASVLEVAA